MRSSYVEFIKKFLIFGRANGIHDGILDMIASVVIMHFQETYSKYPDHPLHERILNLESLENISRWSEIISEAFALENAPFLPLQALKRYEISIASINEMHIKGLNQIHEGNRIVQQRIEKVENSNNAVIQELIKYTENYEKIESKLDYIIDHLNNNSECTGKRRRIEIISKNANQRDINDHIEIIKRSKNESNIIAAESNFISESKNDTGNSKTHKTSNINQILKPSNMKSLFFMWYGDKKLLKYETRNADERSNLKKLSKMICYMKRFLPDNTNLNENMTTGTVVQLGDMTESRVMEFLRKKSRDCSSFLKKAVIWNNLKRLETIASSEFPVPINIVDSVTPKSSQYYDDICNFKEDNK